MHQLSSWNLTAWNAKDMLQQFLNYLTKFKNHIFIHYIFLVRPSCDAEQAHKWQRWSKRATARGQRAAGGQDGNGNGKRSVGKKVDCLSSSFLFSPNVDVLGGQLRITRWCCRWTEWYWWSSEDAMIVVVDQGLLQHQINTGQKERRRGKRREEGRDKGQLNILYSQISLMQTVFSIT